MFTWEEKGWKHWAQNTLLTLATMSFMWWLVALVFPVPREAPRWLMLFFAFAMFGLEMMRQDEQTTATLTLVSLGLVMLLRVNYVFLHLASIKWLAGVALIICLIFVVATSIQSVWSPEAS